MDPPHRKQPPPLLPQTVAMVTPAQSGLQQEGATPANRTGDWIRAHFNPSVPLSPCLDASELDPVEMKPQTLDTSGLIQDQLQSVTLVLILRGQVSQTEAWTRQVINHRTRGSINTLLTELHNACSVGGELGQLVPQDDPPLHARLRDAGQSDHAPAGAVPLHRQAQS